jgi:hypothetical protein
VSSQTATAEQAHDDASDVAVSPTLLSSHGIMLPATFSFKCYGIRFDAAVVRDDHSAARLMVRGDLGAMPYSAESSVARRYMRAVVDAGRDLPHATITLTKSQSIMVRGAMDFPKRPSPALVAAGASAIVLASRPVIDPIEACRDMAKKKH